MSDLRREGQYSGKVDARVRGHCLSCPDLTAAVDSGSEPTSESGVAVLVLSINMLIVPSHLIPHD